MKKALSYILLFSYALVLLRPLLPIVIDTTAHLFWRYEHIATVHYEKGKAHVHFELLQSSDKSDSEKNNQKSSTNSFEDPHEMIVVVFHFTTDPFFPIYLFSPQDHWDTYDLLADYPPPRA